MSSAAEQPLVLESALDLLHQASRVPAKSRPVQVAGLVDAVCRHALARGLDQDPLRSVVQLVSVKTTLDQSSVTTLIKNLYPAQRVPSDVVITVVGALGQGKGKPSLATQDCLVKWLTAVREIIEDGNVLSRLYGVLFAMADMISIRTSLCHLLSLITRRKHVRPFRIQHLLELSRGLGNEPALQGLLRVYKDYYPDIILGSTSTSRKSFAPQPDQEWRTRIAAVQESSATEEENATHRHNGFKVLRNASGRGKLSAIPEVHTYQTTENSVTLEGIDNVDEFVEKLERIEPPGQLVSLLTDPLLQKYLDLKPSPVTTIRLHTWLAACLEDLFESERQGNGDARILSEMLKGVLKHAQYTKTLHPTVLAFMKEYLPIWNGSDNVDTILGILSYVPIPSFEDTSKTYIAPAERALSHQGIQAYVKIIEFYTTLLQNQICVASSQPPGSNNESTKQVIDDLCNHFATLSTSLLLSSGPDHNNTLNSPILSFYELLSTSSQAPPNILPSVPITLPPLHLVYLLAQSPSTTTLSRICGILGAYKQAFDKHPKPVSRHYAEHVTSTFNICLRDMYNMLWVSKGLLFAEGKSVGLFCAPALRATLQAYLRGLNRLYSIETAFGLSSNARISSLSAAAWRALETGAMERAGLDKDTALYHQGPVTKASLEQLKAGGGVRVDWDGPEGYKVHVLRWMEERGLAGFKDLMFAIATNLRGRA